MAYVNRVWLLFIRNFLALTNKSNVAVHGNWSAWGELSACSVTCGGGEQSRSRTCDNPPPAFGGDDCVGESEEIRPCNEISCEGIIIM